MLLWNADNPARMAIDLGTALERLAWARTRAPWKDLVFGPYAHAAPIGNLDALRTATLLLGHGITPAARGQAASPDASCQPFPPKHHRLDSAP